MMMDLAPRDVRRHLEDERWIVSHLCIRARICVASSGYWWPTFSASGKLCCHLADASLLRTFELPGKAKWIGGKCWCRPGEPSGSAASANFQHRCWFGQVGCRHSMPLAATGCDQLQSLSRMTPIGSLPWFVCTLFMGATNPRRLNNYINERVRSGTWVRKPL